MWTGFSAVRGVLDVVETHDGFETDAKPTSSLHASECLYLALASLSRERDVENDNRLSGV
jgi:hypothetical protein